jgi:hypothetical protein
MPRKVEEVGQEKLPLKSIPKPVHELNGGEPLLTPRDAANLLRVSLSWLAKARMRGDGPPYVKLGRAVRYTGTGVRHYAKSRERWSTSER